MFWGLIWIDFILGEYFPRFACKAEAQFSTFSPFRKLVNTGSTGLQHCPTSLLDSSFVGTEHKDYITEIVFEFYLGVVTPTWALNLVAQIARCNRDVRCDSNRTSPNR